MRINKLAVYLVILVLIFVSCVDEYKPELGGKYENSLVVDGTITNDTGPYTITLTRSSSVDNPKLYYYTGCEVTIICDDGNSEILSEESEGVYRTSPAGIRGEIGKSYKIRIVTPEDNIYESAFEEIKAPAKIESVYGEIEYKHEEELNHELRGYQFYIDTKPVTNDTTYLLWKLEYTYKYHCTFLCYYYYEGQLKKFPKADSLNTCWRTRKISAIYTYGTAGVSVPVIKRFPLNYVSTEGRELTIKYSLLVHQYTLSKEAYNFWNSVRIQNENQGSLYTTLPYQIRGNVVNINNLDEPVLGYFQAAGISEKRIFVIRPPLQFYYSDCELEEEDFRAVAYIHLTNEIFWPVYLTKDIQALAIPHDQSCIDCRKSGGTIIKPDFWEGD